ncbi:MAG: hypothetical protein ACLQIB_14745 [Isosphaeraceae bacterium]
MNPIKRLRDELIKRFPGVDAQIDAPAYAMGLWQLDLRPSGGSPWIVVEWKPDTGFGVSTPGADDYGTKPDEPPDPRLARRGLAGSLQLVTSHTRFVTCEDSEFDVCPRSASLAVTRLLAEMT